MEACHQMYIGFLWIAKGIHDEFVLGISLENLCNILINAGFQVVHIYHKVAIKAA